MIRVDGGQIHDLVSVRIDDVAVQLSGDRALVKGHDVLSQCAGLVAENVFDLAQLLVQGGCTCFSGRVGDLVVHLLVPVDEERVKKSYYFYTNIQRDWHHCSEKGRIGINTERLWFRLEILD